MESSYIKYKNVIEKDVTDILASFKLEDYYKDCAKRLLQDYLDDNPDGVKNIYPVIVAAVWIIDKYVDDYHIDLDDIEDRLYINRYAIIQAEMEIFRKCGNLAKYVPADLKSPQSNTEDFWKPL